MADTTLIKGARASRSTIALKLLMAGSGLVFIGFVLTHMYGNLKAFWGRDSFNEYAHHLRVFGEPMLPENGLLWIIRITLLVSLVVHVACAATLAKRASRARSQKYAVKKNVASSLSSRTMRWGGVTLLVFIVWHLINFTIGKVNVNPDPNPAGGPDGTGDPYLLLVDTFDVWWMTIIYLVAMLALGFHLHHGTWSALQTLGLTNSARSRKNAKVAGWVVAIVIAGGFSLVPLAVLSGVITK
ncbi:MAG: succinate dehydrogenase cytochrome b subunit [Nocardioides sp.]|uniref:succinate dehydrogenase cytochrome b subunit n=1 Tax=Nocardioides sp. TaxID=35761 RepID=UPI003F02ECAB